MKRVAHIARITGAEVEFMRRPTSLLM